MIKCKQKKLNHERNKKYDQFKEIPLASKGWKNKKAKGDYFTIHIYNNVSLVFILNLYHINIVQIHCIFYLSIKFYPKLGLFTSEQKATTSI